MSKWNSGIAQGRGAVGRVEDEPRMALLQRRGQQPEAVEPARAGSRRRPRRRWRSGSRGRPARPARRPRTRSTSSTTVAASRLPSLPIPLSYLTWTRGRSPNCEPRSATVASDSVAPDGQLGPRLHRDVELGVGQRSHRQDRDLGLGGAQLEGLRGGGDGEPAWPRRAAPPRRTAPSRGRSRRP